MNKLNNFGPIFYINLDRSPHRRKYIEKHFEQHSITNYQRVPAIDGRQPLKHLIDGPLPTSITNVELAVTLSHIKAIQQFLSYKDAAYAIICEDDIDLSLSMFWPFNWDYVHRSLPSDCECLQLTIIASETPITIPIHLRAPKDWSSCCYVLTRNYAQRIIDRHVKNNKYIIKDNGDNRPVTENIIYNHGTVYSLPLLLYVTDFESEIHPDHVEQYHIPNRRVLYNWWQEQSTLTLADRFNPLTGKVFGEENPLARKK